MKVRKAVIIAAGWGTRFLPMTRTQPKEMLPLVDKPLIQYAVEEAINSGIEQIIMVTAIAKRAIEDYFEPSFELENFLQKKGQTRLLKKMRELSNMADITYIRQKEQLGLGHAVLTARGLVGNEPFAVILPDDIIDARKPALKQLIEVFEPRQGSILAVERVAPADLNKYGIIKAGRISGGVARVLGLVEKPEPAQAPSDLGVVGRYILTPAIFDAIAQTPPGRNEEIQLTDAIALLLADESVYAHLFKGIRYDTGFPLGLLKANVSMALKNPDMRTELREYLKTVLKNETI